MRVLAVDIGTNTTLHLIADVTRSDLELIERGMEANQLGAHASEGGAIGSELMELNRSIIASIVKRGRELGCRRMKGVGTHALRNAVNNAEFLRMAVAEGLIVEIISDAAESRLAWRGAFGASGAPGDAALLDLGGGSSELSSGKGLTQYWSSSLRIGAVSLARHFFQHDPPTTIEIVQAESHARNYIAEWSGRRLEDTPLTGVAGTITTLASLERRLEYYEPGCLEGTVLTAEHVALWRERLLGMDLEGRLGLPGMPAVRAGFIHSGALLLDEIISAVGADRIRVCERGVLFGLAHSLGGQN